MEHTILSAGVVVVRQDGDVWKYLLLRAYNYWDFPKGVVETGEDPLEAACREVEEETCLGELDFRWGNSFSETEPYGQGKIPLLRSRNQPRRDSTASQPRTGATGAS